MSAKGWVGEKMNRKSTGAFQGYETTLYDTIMMAVVQSLSLV